jgi:hypothetical protein
MNRRYYANLPTWIFFGGLACFPWLIVWESAWKGIDVKNLIIAIVISGFAFAWLISFQITITSDEIIFRSLFRGKKRIRHDKIKIVRLTWNLWSRTMRGPLRLIIEPCENSNARELDINAKVFSQKAIDAVLEVGARVAKIDDGGLRDGIVLKNIREWKRRQRK